jgi:multidrug efflux pump subunit AcrA (membrane-fusion protein)
MYRPAPPPKEPLTPPPQSKFQEKISGIGIIEPKSESIFIGVEIPGIIQKIFVKTGDSIKQGAPLFQLDTRDIDAQINVMKKNIITATQEANDARAHFRSIQSVTNRRIISQDAYNKRMYGEKIAQGKLDSLKTSLIHLQTTKERMTTRAPISGQILELNVHPGEYAQGATQPNGQPWILMGDTSTLNVRVEIDEENLPKIKPTSIAESYRRGDTTTPLPLTFVRFEPFVRPKQNIGNTGQRVDTRVLQIIYALPKVDVPLFSGQQLDVFIKR